MILNPSMLSDNADCMISGTRKAFSHKVTHITCLYHLKKGIYDKLKKSTMKPYEKTIWYGYKSLKNYSNQQMFNKVWKLIQDLWEERQIPPDSIRTFENEYIKKDVTWFNGCSFSGKSRTNNSLESGMI